MQSLLISNVYFCEFSNNLNEKSDKNQRVNKHVFSELLGLLANEISP